MRHSLFESHNDLFDGDHAEPFQFGRGWQQRNIGRGYSQDWCIKTIKRLLCNRSCYFSTNA
jgi:hypothetical protein